MATVAKRETVMQRERHEALLRKERLESEIEQLKEHHQEEIRKTSVLWMLVTGVLLFFIFPLGFLIGWFIGREQALDACCRDQRQALKALQPTIRLQAGEAGEQKVSGAIERKLPDDWVLLNDLVIPNGRAGTQIDHVLIGGNGVYCIETKDITGTFYPHRNGWLW